MLQTSKYPLLLVFLCCSFLGKAHADDSKLFIANIPPIAFLMDFLVSDMAEVSSLVSSIDNAELYEPSPKQLLQFSKADLYFTTGLPFEKKWLQVIEENYPQVFIVTCCEDLIRQHDEDHIDPHIWTDPLMTLEISQRLSDVLIQRYPERRKEIEARLQEIEQYVTEIDAEISRELKILKKKVFFVAHPAWSYFASRYQLEQLSIEQEGKEVGISTRVDLQRKARDYNIDTIFTQSQVNPKPAQQFAGEINALIVELNPLAYHHFDNLKYMSSMIIQSMK